MERGTWSKIRLWEYFSESALPAPSLRKAGHCFLPLASLDVSVSASFSYRPSDPLGLPGLRWRGLWVFVLASHPVLCTSGYGVTSFY